jgi:hypothetical protein
MFLAKRRGLSTGSRITLFFGENIFYRLKNQNEKQNKQVTQKIH